MNELTSKYRKAPRQDSPVRLDEFVLARAAAQVRGRDKSRWATPWLAMGVTCCVLAVGVSLILRGALFMVDRPFIVGNLPVEVDESLSQTNSKYAPAVSTSIQREISQVKSSRQHVYKRDLTVDETRAESVEADYPGQTGQVILDYGADSTLSASGLELKSRPSADVTRDELIQRRVERGSAGINKLGSRKRLDSRNIENSVGDSTLTDSDVAEPAMVVSGLANRESGNDESAERVVISAGPIDYQTTTAVAPAQTSDVAAIGLKDQGEPVPGSVPGRIGQGRERPSLAEPQSAVKPDVRLVGDDWLRAKPSNRFTVQLAVAADVDYLREFAYFTGLQGPFVIARDGDSMRYRLLHGDYPTFEAASDQLPDADQRAGQFNPWVRNFGILQQSSGEG